MQRKARSIARVRRNMRLFDSLGQNVQPLEARTLMTAQLVADLNKDFSATLLYDGGQTQFYQQGMSIVATEGGESKTILTDSRLDFYGWAASFQNADQSVLIHIHSWSGDNSVTNYLYMKGDETATPLDSSTSEPLMVKDGHVFDFDKNTNSLRELDLATATFNTIESPLADSSISKFVDLGNGKFLAEVRSDSQPNYYFGYNTDTREFTPITALDGQSPVTQSVPVVGKGLAFLLSGNNVFTSDGTDAGTLPVFASPQKLARINAIGFGDGAILACSVEYFDWDNNVQVDRETLLNVNSADPANPSVVFDSDRGGVDFPSGNWAGNKRTLTLSESAGNVLCLFSSGDGPARVYEVKPDANLVDLGARDAGNLLTPDGMGQFFVQASGSDEIYHTSFDGLETIGNGYVLTTNYKDPLNILPYQDKYLYFSGRQNSGWVVSLNVTDGTAAGTSELMAIQSRLRNLGYLEPPTNYYSMTSHGLVFQGWDAEHGSEPWISDGTKEGTHLLIDLVPGPESSDAKAFSAGADSFTFVASSANGLVQQYQYFWKTGQATPGAVMVQTTDGSYPGGFQTLIHDNVLFTASDGLKNALFLSNGTSPGTTRLLTSDGYFGGQCLVGGFVYFTESTYSGTTRLWKTDGTNTHTELIIELDGSYYEIEPFDNNGKTGLWISNSDKNWISDGTAAGTREITIQGNMRGIVSGHVISIQNYTKLWAYDLQSSKSLKLAKAGIINYLGQFSGRIFLTSSDLFDNGNVATIFSTDGTSIRPSALELSTSDSYQSKSYTDRILLYPTNTVNASVPPTLYVMNEGDSDFSEFQISDYLQGGVINTNYSIENVGDFLYFKVDHNDTETPYTEIWRTDGTAAGTQRLITGDFQPTDFKAWQTGDTSFLWVNSDAGGFGYQVLPGGSLRPTELFNYSHSTNYYDIDLLGAVGGHVLFSYNDPVVGYEPFTLPIVQPVFVQPIPDATIDENLPWSLQASASGEEGPVRYSLVAGAEYGLTINPETGLISWTPTEAAGGQTYQVTVQATQADNPKIKNQASFSVSVNKTNTPPVLLTITNQNLSEGTAWSLQAVATDSDSPVQTLNYALEGDVPNGLTIDPKTGLLSWIPTELQGGLATTITVKVTDNGSPALSASQSFNIVVNEVNSAPVLANIADQLLSEGTAWSLQAVATDSDSPVQTLTYALEGDVPNGLTIDPKTGLLSWTPSELQGGLATTITLKVTDNGSPALSATQSFKVFVNEVNNAPVLENIANQSVKEGQLLSLKLTATDTDLPTQKLTYRLVGTVPAGASIDPVTGQFQWKPAYKASSATFTVEVSDDAPTPAKTQKQFLVTVRPNPIAARFATFFNSKKQFAGLNVIFTDNVDPVSSQKLTAYRLLTAGKDKKFGTKDDVVVKLKSAKLQSDGKTILLSTSAALSKTQTYQLSALDTILDTYGRPMDGDNDGQFGGPAVTRITKGLIG